MGQAKQRQAAIEALKLGNAEKALQGLDPNAYGADGAVPVARVLAQMFEAAKQSGNVDQAVEFLLSKVNATTRSFGRLPTACQRGCAHCCHAWVSVSAPEALHVAKIVAARGPEVVARVRAAHDKTKAYDFDERDKHPEPCPLLEQNECSVYSDRPKACRLAASSDAGACARAYFNLSDEGIPALTPYLMARESYSVALAMALRKAGLPHATYEMNGALVRALDTEDGERRWLAGEDIFSGLLSEPVDAFSTPYVVQLYERSFGGGAPERDGPG